MPQLYLQILISIFGLFALSRAYLRFKERKLSSMSFVFWMGLWIFGVFVAFDPKLTTNLARFVGIGRGADAVIYLSIGIIFYLIFRIYIKIEDTQRQITTLTRKIALDNLKSVKKTSRRKKTR